MKGVPYTHLEIAQYRREPHPIASMPIDVQLNLWSAWSDMSFSPVGDALRDEAIATGNYASALAMFEKIRSSFTGAPVDIRGMEVVHAHTLILSGDTERGQQLAKSLLQLFDAEQAGRPKHWFARDRASVYAMLGDDERALAELSESVRHKEFLAGGTPPNSIRYSPTCARTRDSRYWRLRRNSIEHNSERCLTRCAAKAKCRSGRDC